MGRYSVIGADGRAYGPVDENGLAQWVREGRVTATSMIRDDSTGAQFVATAHPAIAPLFGAAQAPPVGGYAAPPNYPPPPAYAQPQGYPPPGGYGPAPVQYQTPYGPNAGKSYQGMAIAGFILSFVFSLLGLIFSWIALDGMKKSGNPEGRGLAVAGLVISIIGMVFGCIWFAALLGD